MNKKVLAAAVLAAMTVSTVSAFAAPVFSGDARILTQQDDGGSTYTDMRFRLNADANLGDDLYAHGRLMGLDSNFTAAGTGLSGAAVNIEQAYLGGKIGNVDFVAGRQPVLVGKGLLADINGISGLSLATSAGNVKVDGFLGRSDSDGVIAANVKTKVENVNVGAGYLSRDVKDYYSINADTKISNVALSGEWVKNSTDDKTGYIVKATVGQAAKKGDYNYGVSYRDIEAGAVDANWTTNGAFADSKGFRLEGNYKISDNVNLALYKDFVDTKSDPTQSPNQFRADLSVNF